MADDTVIVIATIGNGLHISLNTHAVHCNWMTDHQNMGRPGWRGGGLGQVISHTACPFVYRYGLSLLFLFLSDAFFHLRSYANMLNVMDSAESADYHLVFTSIYTRSKRKCPEAWSTIFWSGMHWFGRSGLPVFTSGYSRVMLTRGDRTFPMFELYTFSNGMHLLLYVCELAKLES